MFQDGVTVAEASTAVDIQAEYLRKDMCVLLVECCEHLEAGCASIITKKLENCCVRSLRLS
jgi:hypothetical protein